MQKKIRIIIDEHEELNCDKHKIKLKRENGKEDDTVKWVCRDNRIDKFAIDFGWNTPFEQVSYQSSIQGEITPVFKDVRYRRYKYTVCALTKEGELLIDDPDIIIRR